MGRYDQWRGVGLAFALAVLGHVGVGFVWRVFEAPSAWLPPSRMSAEVVAPSVTRVRMVNLGTPAEADSSQKATAQAVLPVPLTAPPLSPPETEGLQMGVFVPSNKLDLPLVPMSAPDTSQLEGLNFSGQPIRVRIFVTASGRVVQVLTIKAAPEDSDAVARIKDMLLATAYIPGRLNGQPVAAQLEMELQLRMESMN